MLDYKYTEPSDVLYVGKFWRMVDNSPKFSPPIFINARVFNKLPTDSPNFSLPKTLEPLIHQKFLPPKFSHVRYLGKVIPLNSLIYLYPWYGNKPGIHGLCVPVNSFDLRSESVIYIYL